MDFESYKDVLNFLEEYFTLRVKDEGYLDKLKYLIEGSRKEKTVTIRSIQLVFLEYGEVFNDFSVKDEGGKRLWMDLLDIWQ
ncbi:hypothetical protein EHW65_20795 [Erwinia psidii]|uniref:hypothetical protein n=1 Tax=Erwinia psidii TaxID=69224 RepID=UPI00226B5EE2|nr:hypothetical protein [Erwinia psidii]MCX8959583.1 hypothetical protein [Erwinia psidii]